MATSRQPIQERRTNSVAISKPALNFAASLAILAFAGIGGVFYDFSYKVIELTKTVEYLVGWGPDTGPRNTAAQGLARDNRMNLIERKNAETLRQLVGLTERVHAELRSIERRLSLAEAHVFDDAE